MPPDSHRPLTVLCIEDEPDHAELLRCALSSLPDNDIQFIVNDGAADVADITAGSEPDIVFLDYRLGARNGVDLLVELRQFGWSMPVVMLTAHGDEYVAIEVTRAGADGYIVKSDLDSEVLMRTLATARQRTAERLETAQLHDRVGRLEAVSRALAESNTAIALDARTDVLTRVFARRAWEESVTLDDERLRRRHRAYCIAIIDVDHFKRFNDTAGHQAGDECLRAVAAVVRASCRAVDLVGRYGGEEFVVFMPETGLDEGRVIAEGILRSLHREEIDHPGLGGNAIVTVSVGVADSTNAPKWEGVLAAADAALYRAKNGGRDRVEFTGL
ncbi:MAG: diguanylate cyclase [Planctomycetes bacterium]|nr:diguanylate cyclase [Planctomycetota bacterium]